MKLSSYVIGILMLFLIGMCYFYYQVSPKNLLQLQNYSAANIEQIIETKPEILEAILAINPIVEFNVDPNTFAQIVLSESFTEEELRRYKTLKQQYESLSLTDIIFLNTTLTQRIMPTFKQLGYSSQDINTLIQNPQFLEAIQAEDNRYLNTLIQYATFTQSNIEDIITYTTYALKNPTHTEEEVVRAINYFDEYLSYELTKLNYSSTQIEQLTSLFRVEELKYITSTALAPTVVFELINTAGFRIEQLPAYATILAKSNEALPSQYAIQVIRHPYVLSPSSNVLIEAPNQSSLLLYLNKTYRLPKGYCPQNLTMVTPPRSQAIYLQKEAATALESLFEALEEKQYQIHLAKGFAFQDEVSDYQSGLSVDITVDGSQEEAILSWLNETLDTFGFIIRDDVALPTKTYHLRYVGADVANELKMKNLTLEEYILGYELLE